MSRLTCCTSWRGLWGWAFLGLMMIAWHGPTVHGEIISYGDNIPTFPGNDGYFGSASQPLFVSSTPSDNVYLSQFDPSMGQLNGVNISITYTTRDMFVRAQNVDPQGLTSRVTMSMSKSLRITGPDGLSLTVDQTPQMQQATLNQGDSLTITTPQETSSLTYAITEDFDSYIGTGMLNFDLQNLPQMSFHSRGGRTELRDAGLGEYWGQVEITYLYALTDPVPEPATLGLLIGGAVAMTCRRKRRRS